MPSIGPVNPPSERSRKSISPFPVPRSRNEVVVGESGGLKERRWVRVFWEARASANQVVPVWEGVWACVARSWV